MTAHIERYKAVNLAYRSQSFTHETKWVVYLFGLYNVCAFGKFARGKNGKNIFIYAIVGGVR